MKAKEVRDLDDEQLVEKVREFREELFNLRFQQRDRRAREHRPAAASAQARSRAR